MPKKYIPIKSVNQPGGGINPYIPPLTTNTPVYSSYTGGLIGLGGIPWGTPNGAPLSDKNHGGIYHVIEYIPQANVFMAHGPNYSVFPQHCRY